MIAEGSGLYEPKEIALNILDSLKVCLVIWLIELNMLHRFLII